MEQLFDDLVEVHLKLYLFLGDFAFCPDSKVPDHLREIVKAYRLLKEILSDLGDRSGLSCRNYSYEDLYWMPFNFVERFNSASLLDRRVLLGEAVSTWAGLHSHLKNAPICPILLEEDRDHSIEGIDF